MDVSLYLHFKKIRVAFHTIEVETIVIFNMEIYDTLIGSDFLYNSIGSKHMVQSCTPFSKKKYSQHVP